MLNKNANCYNIEKNFKYSTVMSTFSELIAIFRTLSMDICQLKCQQWLTNKTKNGKLFRIIKFFCSSFCGKPLWHQKLLLLTATARPFSTLSCFSFFPQTFLELIFATKIKTMLLKQSAVLFTSSNKNFAYIMCLNT